MKNIFQKTLIAAVVGGVCANAAVADVKVRLKSGSDFVVEKRADGADLMVVTQDGTVKVGPAAGFNDDKSNNYNVFVGNASGYANTSGSTNIGIGYSALAQAATGVNNIMIGTSAGYGMTGTPQNNISIGNNVMANATGTADNNIAIGVNAMLKTEGDSNIAIGYASLAANTKGIALTAVGTNTLQAYNDTTGSSGYNDAFGVNALYSLASGRENTSLGQSSMSGVTSGSFNTAVGNGSWTNASGGNNNTVVGADAGKHVGSNSNDNVVIGHKAMHLTTNQQGTTKENVAIGAGRILEGLTTGHSNTVIGFGSGGSVNTNTTNTLLGHSVDATNGITNATAIGANAMVTASNSLILGGVSGTNGATQSVNVGIGTTAPGSRLSVVGLPSGTSDTVVTGSLAGAVCITDAGNMYIDTDGTCAN
jgi:trimeric autotransporter adhesin